MVVMAIEGLEATQAAISPARIQLQLVQNLHQLAAYKDSRRLG
jgi:hypothetical protein